MNRSRALAMGLFDAYSDMADEEQAAALAVLKGIDPAVHDALVQLLVTDALAHDLDIAPWLEAAVPTPAVDGLVQDGQAAPDALRR